MNKRNIPEADFLDILFDGRNKDYGAYQLRKTYNSRLAKAMSVTVAVCLLFAFGYALAGKSKHEALRLPYISDTIFLAEPETSQPPTPPPAPRRVTPVQVATIQSTIPRIVPDQQVRPQDVPPENAQTDDVHISTTTNAGPTGDDNVAPPASAGDGTGVTAPIVKKEEDDGPVIHVQIESAYPGGMEAWKRFLSKTWHTPDFAIDNNIAGTVIVQFVVDKEGNVSNIQALSGPEELRAEAIRVIGRSGKWTPGIQNGIKVASYKRQPIVVQIVQE